MIKFLIFLIVLYFAWKLLRKWLLGRIIKSMQARMQPNSGQGQGEKQNKQKNGSFQEKAKQTSNSKVKWDAETVDYEEIK